MNNFTLLRQAFNDNFLSRGELGASVSVWRNGAETLALHRGITDKETQRPWTADTLIPVFSATKAASASALLLALHREGLTPSMPVGELWPLFPLPHSTIAEALSHQCGLAAFSHPADLFDHNACVAALEKTPPAWTPPQHGYHPHTYGTILDELMLRLTGSTIGTWWETNIRTQLDIDYYIGLPEAQFDRVGTLYPGKADKENLDTPFYRDYLQHGTAIYRAFHTLEGLGTVRLMNTPKAWTCASPAFGGVATAKGMAAFYQACLGNTPNNDGTPLFPEQVREWMSTPIIDGDDLTMKTRTAYSCGFMLDPLDPSTANTTKHPLRHLFGNRGFGHAGAGGSHAFADPATGISFAYAMNHMDLNVLPGEKTQSLIDALHLDLR